MVSTQLMSITSTNTDWMSHREWLQALENINPGEGDAGRGKEGRGAEDNFQSSKVESRHAYRPLFCVATKGRTRSMRKQCQEADLN